MQLCKTKEKTPQPSLSGDLAEVKQLNYKNRQLAETASRAAVQEKFWEKVGIRLPGKCWEWGAGRDKDGYGLFRHYKAHRFSFSISNGEIPNGLCICHTCDNPPCVNPAHLFAGTNTDNIRDRDFKKRQASGDRVGRRLYPERYPKGDDHPFRKDPSLCARGDKNGSRVHIERMSRGIGHTNAKLTEKDVLEIRALGRAGHSYKSIAAQFGLVKSTPWFIITRRTWKHLP